MEICSKCIRNLVFNYILQIILFPIHTHITLI